MVVNVQGHRAQQGRAASLSKKLLTSSVAICQGGPFSVLDGIRRVSGFCGLKEEDILCS